MSDKDEIKIREFLDNTTGLLSRLTDLDLPQFDKRIENLKNNIQSFSKHTVRSGLVGITSSGKSALLNVLLGTGKKVLKEQSKATTNMIVLCSRSEEPELEIYFESGKSVKKSGDKVLSESIWKYTSEDENPQNRYSVKYIKLALPTFILDPDIEIADTPGLDAYGLKEHEDLTLREFLPQADLIVYLASIRSPMKEADRKILNKIMDADQRIIFVQTCKGAVVERSYGEDSTESVADLLEKYKNEFAKSIRPYSKLKNSPIVQVETTHALKYFKNKDLNAWKESGLDEFIHVTKSITKQLQDEYTQKNLRKTVDEINALNQLIKNTVQEESEKEGSIEERSKHLINLKDRYDRIALDKKTIVSKWKEKLNYTAIHNKYKLALSRIYGNRYDFNPLHDKEFITQAQAISKKTQVIKNECLNALDSAKERYREYFNELDIDVRRTDIQNITKGTFFLPNVQKKRVSDALGTAKGSPKLPFWKQKNEITKEYIDKNKFIDDLGTSLKYFFEPLINHLEWWNNTVTYSFIEPLQKKISSFEDDMTNIQKGASYDDTQYRDLTAISDDMEAVLEDISYLCNLDISKRKTNRYIRSSTGVFTGKERADYKNIIVQLGNRLFEGMFHDYYLKCLSEMSDNPQKTVAILGDNNESMINFLRRIMRLDSHSVRPLQETETPFAINIRNKSSGIKDIDLKGEFHDRIAFYALSNDKKSYDAAKKGKLFEKADVIQVMINDLHRVGSAANDITERNLFFELMNQHREKLLFTYPRAAHFQEERLHTMVDEAVAEINSLFAPDRIRWLIYENFEIRYSYFNDLALKILYNDLQPDDCIKEWKTIGIPLDDPFNEITLLEQFEELVCE
jgi:predicted GTPase